MSKRALHSGIAIAFAAIALAGLAGLRTGQIKSETVHVGNADIGGVVTGAKGPEAGVWVIAETTDLPTRFVKIVVTDDQGRYLVPDLPKANYDVWVRGYGLVDSPKVKADAGQDAQPEGGRGAEHEGGGRILSRAVLVLAAAGAAEERLSRHRAAGQRHCSRTSRARANGFARSSTPTAAAAAISWAARRRARFRRAS